MEDPRVVKIEWGRLEGRRPRHAGMNSRFGPHGIAVRPAIARITTEDGATGFGASRASREQAEQTVGKTLGQLFGATGATDEGLAFEFALWDLAGKRAGRPVYALAAEAVHAPAPLGPLRVRCYDTSLYFDDLEEKDERAAAKLIAAEAREGWERGHRAFKIKVGRGGRHMPLEEGTRRDVAVVRAVRQAVGPDAAIMIDANNAYNLNLTKRVLEETADCRVHWMEEPFHEDPILYRDLREWLDARGMATLIADGEGLAAPLLMDWAREGVVQVIQYDIITPGFTRWIEIGRQLDEWGRRSAPHHYGQHYGNYVSCHLATAIRGFEFVEWDEATTPGLDGVGYRIDEGYAIVPDAPGFGLELDDAVFRRAVESFGYVVSA